MAEKKQWEINKSIYNVQYQKEYTRRIYLRFHNIHEIEMIKWLENKENMSGYIKSLIQADMDKHNAELIKK